MPYYVVFDTNVLVSSLISSHDDSATVLIIQKLLSEEIIPLYNVDILNEYNDVLSRKKFNFNQERVQTLLQAIKERGILVDTIQNSIELNDSDDKPFFDVFITFQTENTYLVTGNLKHFPNNPSIVSPKQLIDVLSK